MKRDIKSIFAEAREAALDITRKIAIANVAPSEKQARIILFAAGIALLGAGLSADVLAQPVVARGGQIEDTRIASAVNVLFKFLEGSFGALIMAAAGIGAILSASFGQYKAALSCMVVAVGAFILRSMMNTFFNIQSIARSTGYEN
jgi:hypothetical protein